LTDFTFTAIYKDGGQVVLSDTLSYEDLKRENLSAFKVSIGKSELFCLHLEEGQKLIYRKRTATTPGVTNEKNKHPQIYMIGWRQKIGGKDVQSITYICDWPSRGFQIHQAGKFQDNHPWFYSPFLKVFEVEEGEKYYDTKTKTWRTK